MSPQAAAWLLPWLVFGPLVAAGVVAVLPRGRGGFTLVVAVANLALTAVLFQHLRGHEPVDIALAGWLPPVGIGLRLDGWSAVFLLMTALVAVAVSWYATGLTASHGSPGFWPIWLLLLAGLNGVYLTTDLFNAYVTLELITVTAVGLVALGGRSAWPAALRYLFIAVFGSLLFLMAVAIVYAASGTLQIASAAHQPQPGFPLAATVLISAGLALKTALVPLHSWLPPAHAGAPTAISPIMSALVIKASFYLLFRWWSAAPPETIPFGAGVALGALGCVAIVWASVMALRQDALKRVVAYSTVAQVGYFFVLFPLLSAGTEAAREAAIGVILFAVAHGLAKAAMFMATGALMHSYGTDRLQDLRGAGSHLPVAVFAFGLAGVSLAGLPPMLAFAGKWHILQASLITGHWWWFVAVLLGGLLTLAYVARVLNVLLTTPEDDHPTEPIPRRMVWASMAPALAALVFGFTAVPVIDLLEATPLQQTVVEVQP